MSVVPAPFWHAAGTTSWDTGQGATPHGCQPTTAPPWATPVLSRSERDRPLVNDGRCGGSRRELPAAPACALEGSGPSGHLEGRVYAQARGCAVLVVRMNRDRPVGEAERGVLGDDVARARKEGIHQLRHYYASVMLAGGVSIKELAEYLGHADPAFTLRVYAHLLPSSHDRARTVINERFTRMTADAGSLTLNRQVPGNPEQADGTETEQATSGAAWP